MNWKNKIEYFLQERKVSKTFYQFFYNTLNFINKDKYIRWINLSQSLKEWNEKYLCQYENISLVSPVTWTLNISISIFNIPEADIENWIYWACFSSYINHCISNELILRMEENILDQQKFFFENKINLESDIEQFLTEYDTDYLFERDYIWIDKKIFLQELAYKRECSYKKLIAQTNKEDQYIKDRLSMYRKYEKYEKIIGNVDEAVLEIVEINPQRLNNLHDDCMWYLVRAEDQMYIFYFEDYT